MEYSGYVPSGATAGIRAIAAHTEAVDTLPQSLKPVSESGRPAVCDMRCAKVVDAPSANTSW